MNADDTDFMLIESNLFKYCANDPINNIDPGGNVKVLLPYICIKYKWVLNYSFCSRKTLFGWVTKNYIQVSFRGCSAEHDIRKIREHVVVDSDWLVKKFGLKREKAEHQPGDIFNSEKDAAIAWSLKYFNKKEECAALINRVGNGYAFEETRTDHKKTKVNSPALKKNTVSVIHNHTSDKGFSLYVGGERLNIDGEWIHNNKVPLFMANTKGIYKAWESGKREVRGGKIPAFKIETVCEKWR